MTYQKKHQIGLFFMGLMTALLMMTVLVYIAVMLLSTALAYTPNLEELSATEQEPIFALFQFSIILMNYAPYVIGIWMTIFTIITLATLRYAVKAKAQQDAKI